jgi:hypothetical protein
VAFPCPKKWKKTQKKGTLKWHSQPLKDSEKAFPASKAVKQEILS